MSFPNCVDMKYSKPFIYIIYTWHMSYLKYCSLQMTVAKKLKIGRASPKKQMSPIEIRLRIRTLCFRLILYLHSHLYLNITFRIGLCSSFLTFVFTTLRTFYMTAGSKGSLSHGQATPFLVKLQNVFPTPVFASLLPRSNCQSRCCVSPFVLLGTIRLQMFSPFLTADLFTPCVSPKDKGEVFLPAYLCMCSLY